MLSNSVAMKTRNTDEIRYCCPSCGDNGFHLYYNLRKHLFHCFKCGHKGREEPKRLYTDEAMTEMLAILRGDKPVVEAKRVAILPSCEAVRSGSLAMRYMRNRGIPREKVNAMGCMVSNDPKFENRIIIPVYDYKGTIVFYQARALLKSIKPKYLNPITPKSGALFFNMGYASGESNHLYLTEGIFKALKFWELNLPAVAIFGKEITREQVNTLWNHTDKVTIVLDPDAFNFSIKMMDQLGVMKPWSKLRVLCPKRAVDDMTARDLERYLREVEEQ